MAPAVAEARQLALAAARVVFDRELGDPQVLLGGPDHHLRGELHAGRAQVQARQHVAAQRAHAAVGVLDAGAEEQVQQAREDRVADVAVQPRHRAGLDVVHAVADHHLRAVLERRDEARDLVEVVGQVGVGHHDVAAAARPRSRPGRRCRSRACARPPRARRPPRPARAESSSESLSATTTSPVARPSRSSASSAAVTHASMFSASFRQGITTDTSGAPAIARRPRRSGGFVWATVLMAGTLGARIRAGRARELMRL